MDYSVIDIFFDRIRVAVEDQILLVALNEEGNATSVLFEGTSTGPDAMKDIAERCAEEAWAETYASCDDIDESMDGDAESALASAGWGTDEDYNHYDVGDDY